MDDGNILGKHETLYWLKKQLNYLTLVTEKYRTSLPDKPQTKRCFFSSLALSEFTEP